MKLKISIKDALKALDDKQDATQIKAVGGKTLSASAQLKTENKTPDKKTETQSTVSPRKQKLIDVLDGIDAAYDSNKTRTYDGVVVVPYEEKKYDAPTDEELTAQAERDLNDAAKIKADSLKSSAKQKKIDLENKIAEAENSAAKKTAQISTAYSTAKKNASDEAIKRGIARSSIISEQLKDLDTANIKDNLAIVEAADAEIDDVNAQLDDLKTQLSQAIDQLDAETALQIRQKVEELKKERQKRQDEVLEYNNKIAEKKASTQAKLAAKGLVEKEEYSDEYVNARANKIRALYDYYYDLGSEADRETRSDEKFIAEYVGEDGYDYLRALLGLN